MAKVKVEDQGNKHSFKAGVNDLKNLYAKYGYRSSHGLRVMTSTAKTRSMVSQHIIMVHRILPFGPLVGGINAGGFICCTFAKMNLVDNANALYYSVYMTKMLFSEIYL